VIVLHQAPVAYRGLSMSPFCIKVEAYLRLVGLPYRTADADPRRAPKGKVPWLVDGARTVADSSDIVDYLKTTYGDRLDAGLAPRERAAAVLLRRTVEEHLYWALLHARWVLPEGYAASRAIIAPHLPKLVGGIVLDRVVRPSLRRQFEMQGLGKHGDEDVARRGAEDLAALAGWLGDRTTATCARTSSACTSAASARGRRGRMSELELAVAALADIVRRAREDGDEVAFVRDPGALARLRRRTRLPAAYVEFLRAHSSHAFVDAGLKCDGVPVWLTPVDALEEIAACFPELPDEWQVCAIADDGCYALALDRARGGDCPVMLVRGGAREVAPGFVAFLRRIARDSAAARRGSPPVLRGPGLRVSPVWALVAAFVLTAIVGYYLG
jgi:glutathione S-transferase